MSLAERLLRGCVRLMWRRNRDHGSWMRSQRANILHHPFELPSLQLICKLRHVIVDAVSLGRGRMKNLCADPRARAPAREIGCIAIGGIAFGKIAGPLMTLRALRVIQIAPVLRE